MAAKIRCGACGGDVSPPTEANQSTKGGVVLYFHDPTARFMSTEYVQPSQARLCLSCGHVMLFVPNVDEIAAKIEAGALVPKR